MDIKYGWNVGHCREYYFCMLLLLLLLLHAAAAIVATNTEMSPMFNEKYTSMIAAVATSP